MLVEPPEEEDEEYTLDVPWWEDLAGHALEGIAEGIVTSLGAPPRGLQALHQAAAVLFRLKG